jgi:outer membrane protein OmpA-like peptidoglycan-associated protein
MNLKVVLMRFILFAALVLSCKFSLYAQKEKDKNKKTQTSENSQKELSKKKGKKNLENDTVGILVQEFKPIGQSKVIIPPTLHFKNINVINYYYNPAQLAAIKRLEQNKQWDELFKALHEYVSNFGIENFIRDMELIWKLARVAEYYERMELAKDLYRLIIKHYRNDKHLQVTDYNFDTVAHHNRKSAMLDATLKNALIHYDTLTKFEKDLYVDLDYYYKLVEKRRMVDTLRPPEDVLLNMGEEINSEHEDYGLSIAGNDDIIYFTSKRNVKNSHSRVNQHFQGVKADEDLYFSVKDSSTGYWSEAKPLDGINSDYNEGSPCVSRDGKKIVFVRCNTPDSHGDCDLFISVKDAKDEWHETKNLGLAINSYSWDSHPAFSMTGDTLFFASDRKGGFGGTDIYFSVFDKKKKLWGRAKNIGAIINTRDNEVSPYPHPKYNVLYFSSNGQLLNFGGFDIFKSFLTEKNDWTEPRNVGPLVNGKGDEFYFTIDSQSKWLFYARSEEHDIHNLDLHSFPLPMEAKPNNTVRFSGIFKDATTGQIYKGVVSIIDLSDAVEVAPKYVRENGTFEFELIDKKRYLLLIEGDNFFNIKEVFYMNGDTEVNIPAVSLNSTLTFKSIDFEPNSSEILPAMENNLHLVIDFLVQNPKYSVKVVGHTDSDGNHELNMKLSQSRAEAIKKYIVDYGKFEDNRIAAIGKGDTEPIIPNAKTSEEKKLNRRVEFKIYLTELGEESKNQNTSPENNIETPENKEDDKGWEDPWGDGGKR